MRSQNKGEKLSKRNRTQRRVGQAASAQTHHHSRVSIFQQRSTSVGGLAEQE
jgi:hypothetical protein